MIFHLDGEAFNLGSVGEPFGHGLTLKNSVLFQAKIKIMTSGLMLLDNKF